MALSREAEKQLEWAAEKAEELWQLIQCLLNQRSLMNCDAEFF
jgi:hypothetical protein